METRVIWLCSPETVKLISNTTISLDCFVGDEVGLGIGLAIVGVAVGLHDGLVVGLVVGGLE
jgi:hypothetical protein